MKLLASSSSAATLARSSAGTMVRDPCQPNDLPEWSSGKRDTIKPDFFRKT
ncbi:hypothetical protein [Pseudoxanthomonas spadix]|uniref:hypothetical protein n=1 Tax=Pseudoxanthomonas spadix TaxID=415229 RepID=UPI000230AE81|nr:hypothetical protein [Pseudoxanthomonas spadix]MBP3974177.1 hypothetical protein [Pseudoxanthomonas spadix]